jgi:hypothetical protein
MEFGKITSYTPLSQKYIAAPISYIQIAVNPINPNFRPENQEVSISRIVYFVHNTYNF